MRGNTSEVPTNVTSNNANLELMTTREMPTLRNNCKGKMWQRGHGSSKVARDDNGGQELTKIRSKNPNIKLMTRGGDVSEVVVKKEVKTTQI